MDSTHYTTSFPEWNNARLNNVSRLLNYSKSLQNPQLFDHDRWAQQTLEVFLLATPKSLTALRNLQIKLAHWQDLIIDDLLRSSPDIAELIAPEQYEQIFTVLSAITNNLGYSPFEAIMTRWEQEQPEHIETALKYPATLMASAAHSTFMADLVEKVQRLLQWYGPDGTAPQSPAAWVKLLRHILALTLDPKSNLHEFEFESTDNVDKSIGEILNAFDLHLLDKASVHQSKYLPLARYLLMPNFPSAFQVADLPSTLVYQKSTLWVHFKHGINLSELIELGSSKRRSYTDLIELPLKLAADDNDDSKFLSEVALHEPVLYWAMANGILCQRDSDEFSDSEIAKAFEMFKVSEEKLLSIHSGLSLTMPVRYDMAATELVKHGIGPKQKYTLSPIVSGDGRLTASRNALDLYINGEFASADSEWRTHASVPDFRSLDLPDITARFETEYDAWFSTFKPALRMQLVELIEQLPLSQRTFITSSRIRLYSLRKASGQTVATDETTGTVNLIGPAGLLMVATKSGRRRCYEVFPYKSLIVVRDDAFTFTEGGKFTYPKLNILAGPSHGLPAHSGWHSGTMEALDWTAYSTPAAPLPGVQSSVIIKQFAEFDTEAFSLANLSQRLAELAIDEHFLRDPDTLRKHAKGIADSDQSHWFISFLKNFVVPFWAGIEDIVQGIREDRPGLVRRGIGITIMDLTMISPMKTIGSATLKSAQITGKIARHAALRGLGSGKTAAVICARVGLKVNAPELSMLARVATREIASIAVPFYGLLQLLRIGGPKLLQLGKAGHARLHHAMRSLNREHIKVSYPIGMSRVKSDASGNYPLKVQGDQLRRVNNHPQVVTRMVGPASGRLPERYLVDLHSAKPYGPRLIQIDDQGALSSRVPANILVENVAGRPQAMDPLPGLRKQWVLWADDLYLDAGDVLYKRIVTPEGPTVLRQVHDPRVSGHMPELGDVSCRVERSKRNLTICIVGSKKDSFADSHTEGREVVSWFQQRTISTKSKKYVFNNQKWIIHSGLKVSIPGVLPVENYKAIINVEVLGGNELFKTIRIKRGFYPGNTESQKISAVLATRRSDGRNFLITRADRGVFYKGEWVVGNREISMSKINVNNPLPATPTENDYLAAIYTGSHDAHLKIKEMGPEKVNDLMEDISNHLDRYRNLNEYGPYIGGPFDMGTTPAQAALFCHLTQMRLNAATRAGSLQWSVINASTAEADLSDIVLHLNRLEAPAQAFDLNNILDGHKMRLLGKAKNIAYLKLNFKDPSTPPVVYFSASGMIRKGPKLALTRFINGSNETKFPGWQRERESKLAIAPDGVRYINAQPTQDELNARPRTFTLPDTSTPEKFLSEAGNPRTLDSEKNIMERMKADAIDFDTIESADLFSKYPTCPSCTETMHELQTVMPNGRFNVFEGLPRSQAPD